jgi:hypothetical protein
MRIRSRISRRRVPTTLSQIAFALGARGAGWAEQDLHIVCLEDGVEGPGVPRVALPEQEA